MSVDPLTSFLSQMQLDDFAVADEKENKSPEIQTESPKNTFPIRKTDGKLVFDEPLFNCLVCGHGVPVLEWRHRQECFYSEDNYQCPFCDRRRRPNRIEDHMNECARKRKISPLKRDKAIYSRRFSSQAIEKIMVEARKNVLEGYKTSLKSGEALLICETLERHEGELTVEEEQFKKEALLSFNSEILPHFESYLAVLKDERIEDKVDLFESRWLRERPDEPYDESAGERLAERTGQKCDRDNEVFKKEKLVEIEKIINRHVKILAKEMAAARLELADKI
ncbi:hypothetical protein GCK72_025789 [Caenorhabditis remanei]|uniref:Uncharacterized protein n=1 Tax=Caenorhabditis remanei TaxID=31234 RepID=A0A6A5G3P5_CAERE|nr:hypothetical protein GCK72_025789 [Caenorhabditis remanei]KAF1749322.1 hypothetical protein GCK72_025789 [Caenorhabditis remanei]